MGRCGGFVVREGAGVATGEKKKNNAKYRTCMYFVRRDTFALHVPRNFRGDGPLNATAAERTHVRQSV